MHVSACGLHQGLIRFTHVSWLCLIRKIFSNIHFLSALNTTQHISVHIFYFWMHLIFILCTSSCSGPSPPAGRCSGLHDRTEQLTSRWTPQSSFGGEHALPKTKTKTQKFLSSITLHQWTVQQPHHAPLPFAPPSSPPPLPDPMPPLPDPMPPVNKPASTFPVVTCYPAVPLIRLTGGAN